jgi:hypothetical protein
LVLSTVLVLHLRRKGRAVFRVFLFALLFFNLAEEVSRVLSLLFEMWLCSSSLQVYPRAPIRLQIQAPSVVWPSLFIKYMFSHNEIIVLNNYRRASRLQVCQQAEVQRAGAQQVLMVDQV